MGRAAAARLLLLAAVLLASPLVVALQALLKHQALAGNFPMRLRWNFHRLMLRQSMSFYQDEFAGRVATKVMQTALAVRDVWMILADILVFVRDLFRHAWSPWSAASTPGCCCRSSAGWRCTSPRCATSCRAWAVSAQAQADARSLMTGRITDAYTNIATVKLFSHAQARGRLCALGDAGVPGARCTRRCGWSPASRSSTTLLGMALIAGHRRRRRCGCGRRARSASARWPRPPRWRCA